MIAYLLILVAVLSRVLPHAGWWNFTAVTGSLLYFGGRRPWREMLAPVAVLMATDYFLTTVTYHFSFHWQAYVTTWVWYAAAIVLGSVLLRARASWLRVGAAALLGPTSFFVVSNYAVWAGSGMYPHNLAGLEACYIAGIPFYRNDIVSAAILLGAAFGVPALVRRMRAAEVQHVSAAS